MNFSDVLSFFGIAAFAISGALTAMEQRMDIFGTLIISFATAFGGGTIRDVLIDVPVLWIEKNSYMYVFLASWIFAVIFRNYLEYLRKTILFFDTIGLGLFTTAGVSLGMATGQTPLVSITLGTITGTFGGILRDILCGEVPILFRREIYATVTFVGGIIYVTMDYFDISPATCALTATLSMIVLRFLVIIFHWTLPSPTLRERKPK